MRSERMVAGGRAGGARQVGVLTVASAALVLGGCSGGVLAPASPEAELITAIGWFMFVVSGVVFGIVLAMLIWALVRGRRERDPGSSGVGVVVLGGVVLPLLLLPILWLISLPAMADLADPGEPIDIEVEITGRQWSYEVRYPGHDVEVRDQLRLPIDERVLLRLTSADVIHSFWVPELGGKRDMIPGTVNEISFRPTRAGTFTARCAEFCGVGHAAMTMQVVVEPREDLEAWLSEQAAAPTGSAPP